MSLRLAATCQCHWHFDMPVVPPLAVPVVPSSYHRQRFHPSLGRHCPFPASVPGMSYDGLASATGSEELETPGPLRPTSIAPLMLSVRVTLAELDADVQERDNPDFDCLDLTTLEKRLQQDIVDQTLPAAQLEIASLQVPPPSMVTMIGVLGLMRILQPGLAIVKYTSWNDGQATGCLPISYMLERTDAVQLPSHVPVAVVQVGV
jgi:hypothetical protein